MSAVEFSPQSAGVINVEQSEAARAKDTDIGATTISAKAATVHNRMVDFLVFITVIVLRFSHDNQAHTMCDRTCQRPSVSSLLQRSMRGLIHGRICHRNTWLECRNLPRCLSARRGGQEWRGSEQRRNIQQPTPIGGEQGERGWLYHLVVATHQYNSLLLCLAHRHRFQLSIRRKAVIRDGIDKDRH